MKFEVKKYRNKDGTEKIHHLRVIISKSKLEASGLKLTDNIEVRAEKGRLIIEKARS